MKLEFHPEALAEYEDSARYYAGCQENLELRFIAAIETCSTASKKIRNGEKSLRTTSGAASRMFFPMPCFTALKRISCSSLP